MSCVVLSSFAVCVAIMNACRATTKVPETSPKLQINIRYAYILLLIHHEVGRTHSVVGVNNKLIVVEASPDFGKHLICRIFVRLGVKKKGGGRTTYRIVTQGGRSHRRVIVVNLVTLSDHDFVQENGFQGG